MLKLRCWALGFTSYTAFSKNKRMFTTSLFALLSAEFFRKNISHVIFYQLSKYHSLIGFTLEILGNMCMVVIYFPVYDVIIYLI